MLHEEAVIALIVFLGVAGCGGMTSTGTERHVDVGTGASGGMSSDGSVPGGSGGSSAGGTTPGSGGSGGAGGVICECFTGECAAGYRAIPVSSSFCNPPCRTCEPCGPVNCPNVPACAPGQHPITPQGECCPSSCGAAGSGGAGGAGGLGAGGFDGGTPSACCQKDLDCGDIVYVPCVNGMCKTTVPDRCWTNAECTNGASCVGVFVCQCGRLCDQGDAPGTCQPPMTDAGSAPADAGQAACVPPPNLPPTSPTCTDLPYSPLAESYVIWIANPSAPGGGQPVMLAANQAVTVGGHTYKNTGAGLVGGGSHGIYGDASFDVDGVSNALSFHFEGCAAPVSTDTWELVAAVTRNGPSCTSCPESITRRYSIRRTGSGSTERYTFDAEGPPQACKLGADLLEIVLY